MNLLNRRIPTIFGIFVLVIGIGAGIYFVGKETLFGPQLSPELAPKKVKITNIKNSQFTVSWITNEAGLGFVRYGNTPALSTTIADDREQRSGTSLSFKTHYVTITGLQASTKYYFKIGSGSEKNLYDDNGRPYEVTTAPTLGAAPPPELANGTILTASGKPASGAIIYITLPGATPLSALIANDGSWVVNLASALTNDLTGYAQIDPETTPLDLLAQGESQVSKALTTTALDNPVPEIILGQTYDFRTQSTALATPSPSPEAGKSKTTEETAQIPGQFPLDPLEGSDDTPDSISEVSFTNPSLEGETIYSLRPEIKGTGPARKVLTITIESPNEYSSTVIIDEDGTWSYTPPEELEPGEHTVSLSYVDDNGEDQTMSRSFIVAAAADQGLPAFTATPSASPSPTPQTTPRTTMPSTESGVPASGTVSPTLGLSLLGFLLLAIGFVLKLASFGPVSVSGKS